MDRHQPPVPLAYHRGVPQELNELPHSDGDERGEDLAAIRDALGKSVMEATDTAVVALGDSLRLIRSFPERSVSLILCDPPYHSTHKANIVGDRAFTRDQRFVEWLKSYADEWQRILRSSGTVYVFCSSRMSSRIEVALSEVFLPVSNITWTKPNEPGYDGWKGKTKKESLRQWYPHSERVLVFEQGAYGAHKATRWTPLSACLREHRQATGLTAKELTEAVGAYGTVNHGGAVSNWETGRNIPSRQQYALVVEALGMAGAVSNLPPYNDLVRPLNLSKDMAFTDIWDFPSVRPYKGKHPAGEAPKPAHPHHFSV